ncbi:MAG: type II toxin-antitoxin system RelE/ParE family toxin [Dyadobacter sp.]
MIETIAYKGLRLLWQKNNSSKLPAEQVEKIKRILSVLNTAKTLDPIKAMPGYRLHQLSGDLKGYWAIWYG